VLIQYIKVTFIQTGGSIDKDYPRVTNSYVFEIGESAVKEILGKVSLNPEFKIILLLQKDGLDTTDEHRHYD